MYVISPVTNSPTSAQTKIPTQLIVWFPIVMPSPNS
jgi:hypothetical protein